MNKIKESRLKLRDNTTIYLYEFNDVKNPKGVVQLVHGSCEHVLRYVNFINFLNQQGFIVVGDDHRGHGKTVINQEDFGVFAEHDGWKTIVDDLKEVNDYIKLNYPNLPIIMFGHSLGSFMARAYAFDYSASLTKLILSGTSEFNPLVLKFGIWLATKHQKKWGYKTKDQMIYKMSYKPLNKKFKKESIYGMGYLTTNQAVQKEFYNDPFRFDIYSTSGYKDLFTGLLEISKSKNIKKTSNALKILFIAGSDDPVGNFTKAVKKVYQKYIHNKKDCQLILYKNMRHEILNEPDYQKVYQDVIDFIVT